jgi:drug/metabolite transporter (DMT)-like permease
MKDRLDQGGRVEEAASQKLEHRSMAAIGIAFVMCWASGFVVARVLIPYAEPVTFVALRNGGAAIFLAVIAVALRCSWPRQRDVGGLLWVGALLQGFSVMGLYWAVYWGLPVGIAALVGGLQPAFTAMFAAALLGEDLGLAQWSGIALGFLGLTIAVWPKVSVAGSGIALVLSALAGVACMAYASIRQKRYEHAGDPWSRTTLMFVGASIPAAVGATLLEHGHVVWNGPMVAVYTWSVAALAVGATMSLLFLIARGQAARAAALIYLVPPTSALMAYLGFGERIGVMQIAGFFASAVGVALVQFGPGRATRH